LQQTYVLVQNSHIFYFTVSILYDEPLTAEQKGEYFVNFLQEKSQMISCQDNCLPGWISAHWARGLDNGDFLKNRFDF